MNTKEMIAVMQAHLDGKQIEIQIHGLKGWAITTCPQWNWGECDYRIEQTKKVVDLSVLIDRGIDCEFWDTGTEEIIHIGKLIAASNVYEMAGCVFQNCRPRMSHIHAIKLSDIGMEPMNIMQQFKDAGFVFENSITCQNDRKMFLLLWDFDKSPDHCYPWECDE